MRKLNGVMFAAAAVIAAILFIAPASFVSADSVKVHYQPAQNIEVVFLGGQEIERGGEFTIRVTSSHYDMSKISVMLYSLKPNGEPDRTTTIPLERAKVVDGNSVTVTFFDLTTNVFMEFYDLVLRDPLNPDHTDEYTNDGTKKDAPVPNNGSTTVAIAVSSLLAGIMLAMMAGINRKIDSFSKGSGGVQ